MKERTKILGIGFDNINIKEAQIRTKELIEKSNKSCKIVVAPNTEFIMMAQKDKEFFDILKKANCFSIRSFYFYLLIAFVLFNNCVV